MIKNIIDTKKIIAELNARIDHINNFEDKESINDTYELERIRALIEAGEFSPRVWDENI